jgi:hypothetical protein
MLAQRLADAKCRVYALAYSLADLLYLPTEPIRKRYVRAVRHANAIYWYRHAVTIGDGAYTERYPDPR